MEVVGLEQNVIDRSLEAAVVGSALWLAVLSVCRDEWCTAERMRRLESRRSRPSRLSGRRWGCNRRGGGRVWQRYGRWRVCWRGRRWRGSMVGMLAARRPPGRMLRAGGRATTKAAMVAIGIWPLAIPHALGAQRLGKLAIEEKPVESGVWCAVEIAEYNDWAWAGSRWRTVSHCHGLGQQSLELSKLHKAALWVPEQMPGEAGWGRAE